MAIYNLSEILDCIESMKRDGYEYLDISELPADGEIPEGLCIAAIIDANASEEEMIDSVELPVNYSHLS